MTSTILLGGFPSVTFTRYILYLLKTDEHLNAKCVIMSYSYCLYTRLKENTSFKIRFRLNPKENICVCLSKTSLQVEWRLCNTVSVLSTSLIAHIHVVVQQFMKNAFPTFFQRVK